MVVPDSYLYECQESGQRGVIDFRVMWKHIVFSIWQHTGKEKPINVKSSRNRILIYLNLNLFKFIYLIYLNLNLLSATLVLLYGQSVSNLCMRQTLQMDNQNTVKVAKEVDRKIDAYNEPS